MQNFQLFTNSSIQQEKKIRLVCIGAGIEAMLSVYAIAKHYRKENIPIEINVIERYEDVACATSYSNGGHLTEAEGTPLAKLNNLNKVSELFPSGWLTQSQTNMSIRRDNWCQFFKKSCQKGQTEWVKNAYLCANLGRYSLSRWQEIAAELPHLAKYSDFNFAEEHLLRIYTDPKLMLDEYEALKAMGVKTKPYSLVNIIEHEKAFTFSRSRIIGGFVQQGGCIDARRFSRGLQQILIRDYQVKFDFNIEAMSLVIDDQTQKATGINTSKGIVEADLIIACSGTQTKFLENCGIDLQVEALGGCTLTIPMEGAESYPTKPLKYLTKDGIIVFSPYVLGQTKMLRVGGLFYLGNQKTDIESDHAKYVINQLKLYTHELFPQVFENAVRKFGLTDKTFNAWEGFRPITPDGVPLIGQCKYSNVFLNTGQGTGGTSLAPGSADVLLACITNNKNLVPNIDIDSFNPTRFQTTEQHESKRFYSAL